MSHADASRLEEFVLALEPGYTPLNLLVNLDCWPSISRADIGAPAVKIEGADPDGKCVVMTNATQSPLRGKLRRAALSDSPTHGRTLILISCRQ